jgi:hypothetical protein
MLEYGIVLSSNGLANGGVHCSKIALQQTVNFIKRMVVDEVGDKI